MMDVSMLTDKELFELEKKIKEERSRRDSYICYKNDLLDHEMFGEMIKALFGQNIMAITYGMATEEPMKDASYKAYDQIKDSLFTLADICLGNCVVSQSRGKAAATKSWMVKRNTTVEGDLKERYEKTVNQLLDILAGEAVKTGQLKMKP